MPERVRFDGAALMEAVTARRDACDLSWPEAADAIHDQSEDLNAELGDHRMCSGALVRTVRRGTMSCQYALPLLRWLAQAPEDFLVGPVQDVGPTALPAADAHQRLRWDLAALHHDLDTHRRRDGQSWAALAADVGCSPSRLTNLRTARLADMDLAMQLAQRVRRPAAAFIHATDW